MIVRFFKSGLSSGEAPVNYLFSMRDHAGNIREYPPELLEGSPQLTTDLINSINRQHKYASGCLAFRSDEQPTKKELLSSIDRFKAVVAPGLSSEQFNSLFVLHREAPKDKGDEGSFHVHFVFPMTLLSGQTVSGKSLAGKRWNPHPPGQRTIQTMALFTAVVNHEHGWKRVTEAPLHLSLDCFWRKASQGHHIKKSELLRKEIARGVMRGEVNNRDDLIRFLDQTLGLTITRQTAMSVSVRFPGHSKAMKLKGAMFERNTDYSDLRAAAISTANYSISEYLDARMGLEALLRQRAAYLQGTRTSPHAITTTRKERYYGRNRPHQPRLGGHQEGSQYPVRDYPVSVTTSGMERNLLQAGAGQWSHANGIHDQASHVGPQGTENPIQHAHDKSGRDGRRQRQRLQRGSGSSPIGDIDQEIWALAVQLNHCEQGSFDAFSILSQLNFLQAEKQRIPQRPKPHRNI